MARRERRPPGGFRMRVSATTTSLSWIPSDSVWGPLKLGFDLGVSHWDEPMPDRISGVDEVQELHDAGPVPVRQRPPGLGGRRGRPDRRSRLRGPVRTAHGGDDGPVGAGRGDLPGGRAAGPAHGRGHRRSRRRGRGVPPDRRRPDRDPAAPPGAAPAVRALAGAAGVDDPCPDRAGRRHVGRADGRRQRLPAALGLRHRRQRGLEVGAHRREPLDAALVRRPHAVERPGPGGLRHAGGVAGRAGPVVGDHARRGRSRRSAGCPRARC